MLTVLDEGQPLTSLTLRVSCTGPPNVARTVTDGAVEGPSIAPPCTDQANAVYDPPPLTLAFAVPPAHIDAGAEMPGCAAVVTLTVSGVDVTWQLFASVTVTL